MNWFKRGLKRYDDWCKEMGLTPDQKRSCVPYRKDPINGDEGENAVSKPSPSDLKNKHEAL
ncbi:DUF5363 family protein [Vibrio mytili]|uniref:DUF5363 family protein n=1 Tax=Vibrio mytili TaxID=50718 RepID=A0A0C3I7M8_9VIBR|nr:DUF5363 family protein [Vibrio mytili]KIN10317.1 hypothetical protein SU60_14515 [Vibrio mytili]